jgi:drug/metabolite transporter (DMT)-like permease
MERAENRTLFAIGLTMVALIGFDTMGILVRIMSARGYGTPELAAYRNVLGVIPSFVVLLWMREIPFTRAGFRVKRWKLALFRGATVAVAQLSFYTALTVLELATISALAQTSALFIVLLSVIMFREKVGPWRIFALIFGFAGALLILRPGSDSFTPIALLPILASLCYGFSIVSVRFFDNSVPSALLLIYSSVASACAGIVLALATSGFSPIASWEDAALILALALSGGVAVLLLMFAYRIADPSVLAPFSYVGILTAFFFGWAIFDEAPVDTLFPGVLLIVGAGAVIIWREHFVQAR